jgi:hypothetical protein
MGDRLSLAHEYISKGHPKLLVLGFAGVPKSSYYEYINPKVAGSPGQSKAKGRPIPGYSKSLQGAIVLDATITEYLKEYRSDLNYKNGGG